MEEQEPGEFVLGPLYPRLPDEPPLLANFSVRDCVRLKVADESGGPVFRCILSPGDHIAVFRCVSIEAAGE